MEKTPEVTVQKWHQSERFWIVFIAIFYAVGMVGISNENWKTIIVPLSSAHLFLTFWVLYFSRRGKKDQFLLYAFLLFLIGVFVEIIGTKTGWLFGNYAYGKTLGWKILGVPAIIGVNWATMVICSSSWVSNWNTTIWWKAIAAALIMTGLDFLIEPVAMQLDFWQWENDTVPFYNYVCWFVISIPMHLFYIKWNIVENNSVPKSVYVLMLVFFVVLNWK
ncbi:MAG: carotenoid biosynthesis protein [Crocinitomicaceae bacterium]